MMGHIAPAAMEKVGDRKEVSERALDVVAARFERSLCRLDELTAKAGGIGDRHFGYEPPLTEEGHPEPDENGTVAQLARYLASFELILDRLERDLGRLAEL